MAVIVFLVTKSANIASVISFNDFFAYFIFPFTSPIKSFFAIVSSSTFVSLTALVISTE